MVPRERNTKAPAMVAMEEGFRVVVGERGRTRIMGRGDILFGRGSL